MHKTYKFRLYPTKQQTAQLLHLFGRLCSVYNAALQQREEARRRIVRVYSVTLSDREVAEREDLRLRWIAAGGTDDASQRTASPCCNRPLVGACVECSCTVHLGERSACCKALVIEACAACGKLLLPPTAQRSTCCNELLIDGACPCRGCASKKCGGGKSGQPCGKTETSWVRFARGPLYMKYMVGRTVDTQSHQVTILREDPEWEAINSKSLHEPLVRLDHAYNAALSRFLSGKTAGWPRYQSRDHYRTLTFAVNKSSIVAATRDGSLRVPNVSDPVSMRTDCPIEGEVRTVKVTAEADRWYACISCVNVPAPPPLPPAEHRVIGVDVGVSSFAALSTGELVANPRHGQRAAEKLARAQRALAAKDRRIRRAHQRATGAATPPKRLTREEIRSKKRQKLVLQIQRAHAQIKRTRDDFHWKTALKFVRLADVIALEDLQIKNMTRSAKGDAENPGRRVRQKSGLNRAILDAAWGGFVTKLWSKCIMLGRDAVKVVARGSSQECSGCGREVRKDLSVRVHKCPYCGLEIDRDVNAAITLAKRADDPSQIVARASQDYAETVAKAEVKMARQRTKNEAQAPAKAERQRQREVEKVAAREAAKIEKQRAKEAAAREAEAERQRVAFRAAFIASFKRPARAGR